MERFVVLKAEAAAVVLDLARMLTKPLSSDTVAHVMALAYASEDILLAAFKEVGIDPATVELAEVPPISKVRRPAPYDGPDLVKDGKIDWDAMAAAGLVKKRTVNPPPRSGRTRRD